MRVLPIAVAFAASSFAVAQDAFAITQPSADIWWVAKSSNVLAWSCKNSPYETFIVLIGNSDPKTGLTRPMPFIASQPNSDCSKSIDPNIVLPPADTGYTISFANPLNVSDVYATSQQFEIKPLGSAYPTTSSALPLAAASSPGTAATPSKTSNDAVAVNVWMATIFGVGCAALLNALQL